MDWFLLLGLHLVQLGALLPTLAMDQVAGDGLVDQEGDQAIDPGLNQVEGNDHRHQQGSSQSPGWPPQQQRQRCQGNEVGG